MFDQVTNKTLTLADVIEHLNARRDIDATKRRDMVSAINRTARLLDLSPKDMPANVLELRARLLTIHPTPHGLNKRSWANVKSNLARALKEVGIIGDDKAVPRTKAWNTLLSETPEDHHGYQLARLARFCSARGVEPTEVSDDTIAEFYRHLDDTLLSREPFKPVKDTVDAWNGVRRECGRICQSFSQSAGDGILPARSPITRRTCKPRSRATSSGCQLKTSLTKEVRRRPFARQACVMLRRTCGNTSMRL